MRNASSDRRVATAGSTFVAAWVAGLLVAPGAPEPDAPAAAVAAHYVAHQAAATLQSVVIHGVAGVALIVLALALGRERRGVRVAGIAGGAVSLFQAGTGILLAQHYAVAGGAGAAFDVLNSADTVKLIFVGAFAWLVTRGMGTRMRIAGAVLAPLEAVAGLAFVTGSPALYGLLYLALPALLVWVGALACCAWGARPAAAAAAVAG